MNKTEKWCIRLSIITTCNILLFWLPLEAKAEWYVVGYSSDDFPIYIDNESVVIKGEVRSAKVEHNHFGPALFAVNCRTDEYYLQSNQGREKDYAAPGTVAGVMAEEICDEYSPTSY